MAEEQNQEEQQEQASPLVKVLVLLIVLLVVLGGIGATLLFVMGGPGSEDELGPTIDQNKVGMFWPPEEGDDPGLIAAGNLAGRDTAVHFKATVFFELAYYHDKGMREASLEEMNKLKRWIADVCRRHLASRTESQVNNPAEQQRIKNEIKQELNQRLKDARIEDIVFPQLLTQ
jgi:flagellar basal body-associated protein FliL